ncbi:MAG: DNA polymerase III subunit gamma/tau [Clostridia bacterium]|nr:DNA polymerase III subunit gamma/tau [Clostridia bacterium]
MHVALYRKYRSATFSDVCGQEHITSTLRYQAKTGRVSHAYLFCGSRGIGKTTCARILAKAVNCEDPHDGEPCGVCDSCRMIDRGSATDVIEMDAASETGVDYIRSIKEDVQYLPSILKKKIYIIDEVHMLSDSAFNALLKTLEEPPEHVIFILATTEIHKLPPTVVSRCQRFDFKRLSTDVITSRLFYIAEKENIKLEEPAALIIAKQAEGGMRDAVSLLDLCSGGGADVTEERVRTILGVNGYETVAKFAGLIADRDVAGLFSMTSQITASSKDIGVFWRELASFYRDMLVAKYAKNPGEYLDLTKGDLEILTGCAKRFTLAKLYYHSKILDNAQRDMVRMPEIKRVTAEFALVRMCDETLDTTPDALIARIEALESAVSSLRAGNAAPRGSAEIPAPPAQETPATPAAEKKIENDDLGKSKTTAEQKSAVAEQAPPAPAAPRAQPAAKDGADRVPVPDLTEVAELVGRRDFMARALLAECRALLSSDGSKIWLRTENPFAETYFERPLLDAVSDAFIECKINDRPAQVTVEVVKGTTSSASDELFKDL